jgi:squalene-hopene/tetraprenyl-beta-curcumene cyclase
MGLCTFDDPNLSSLVRGVQYLIDSQNEDGSWSEHETTGTGFPRVFYLKYDMYRNSWPLLALATYQKLLDSRKAKTSAQANGAVRSLALR